MHEEVLTKIKIILSADHSEMFISMHNLTMTYLKQDKMMEVTKMYEKELMKSKTILSEDHSEMLISMHNLTETYRE